MSGNAQSIQDAFLRDDSIKIGGLEAEFIEIVLWYDGFRNQQRMRVLPYEKEDLDIINLKMQESRDQKDFKTSDYLRDVLRDAGVIVKNK